MVDNIPRYSSCFDNSFVASGITISFAFFDAVAIIVDKNIMLGLSVGVIRSTLSRFACSLLLLFVHRRGVVVPKSIDGIVTMSWYREARRSLSRTSRRASHSRPKSQWGNFATLPAHRWPASRSSTVYSYSTQMKPWRHKRRRI